MELNHSVPLQYDFLRISNMLPEALEYGGKCVPRQCEVLLKRNCDDDFQRLWQRQSEAPWDGRVTTEMMQEFCAQNNINLMAFHGNRKVVHQTATSDVWLTYFSGMIMRILSRTRGHMYRRLCPLAPRGKRWKWIVTLAQRKQSQVFGQEK